LNEIQRPHTKEIIRRANSLGFSRLKWGAGSTHPTVPHFNDLASSPKFLALFWFGSSRILFWLFPDNDSLIEPMARRSSNFLFFHGPNLCTLPAGKEENYVTGEELEKRNVVVMAETLGSLMIECSVIQLRDARKKRTPKLRRFMPALESCLGLRRHIHDCLSD
jgi:hypothetical protein